jgi:hypothetical protein
MHTDQASIPPEPPLYELVGAEHFSNSRDAHPPHPKWTVSPGGVGALMRLGISPSVLLGAGETPPSMRPRAAGPRATPCNAKGPRGVMVLPSDARSPPAPRINPSRPKRQHNNGTWNSPASEEGMSPMPMSGPARSRRVEERESGSSR